MKTSIFGVSIGGLICTLRVGLVTTAFLLCVMAPGALASAPSGPPGNAPHSPPNLPPLVPSGPSPPNGAQGVLLDVQLTWSASDPDGDALVYDVQFGTFSLPPTVATNLSVASYTPTGLSYNTTYYWRVIVRDTAGHEVYGFLWAFTTRPVVCTPMNVAPPNNSINQPQVLTLTWDCAEAGADPVVYDVYFGSSLPAPRVATGITDRFFTPARLAGSTKHWWRVHARNAAGVQVWNNLWSFTTEVGNAPPSPPYAPSPGSGATTIPTTPTLMWHCQDPDGDALEYDVYFGIDANPPLVATGVSTATYAPGQLLVSTTYRWRIVARDPRGLETSGPVWAFTTRPANSPPWEPSYHRPWYGASNWSVNTWLEWSGGDLDGHPVTYDVYFGTDATPPLVATDLAARYYPIGPLAFTTRYYWRILARDPLGLETSGPTYYFTTKANSPPNPAANPIPAIGQVTSLAPALSWFASDQDGQALTYDVFFGTTLPPPRVAMSLPTPNYSPGTLQALTQYYWRIEASDGQYLTSGPLWSFTAFQPGDVVTDGYLALNDASCAMQVYLWNPTCSGPSAYTLADVNCDDNVTPLDARCIHKQVVDGSCALCEGAVGSGPSLNKLMPTVSLGAIFTRQDTLIVSLSTAGIPSLESIGMYVISDPKVRFLQAVRSGASSGFAVLDFGIPSPGTAVIGGYTLTSVPAEMPTELVELHFDVGHGMVGALFIDGFVDDLHGAGQLYIPIALTVDVPPIGSEFVLHQNHPNPFNPQTTITYDLPSTSERVHVRLWIIDISGHIVRTLVDESQSGGSHRVDWQGKDDRGESVSSGVYFYALDAGGERRTRKLVLLK